MASTRAARNGRLLAVLLVAPFMAQADATINAPMASSRYCRFDIPKPVRK